MPAKNRGEPPFLTPAIQTCCARSRASATVSCPLTYALTFPPPPCLIPRSGKMFKRVSQNDRKWCLMKKSLIASAVLALGISAAVPTIASADWRRDYDRRDDWRRNDDVRRDIRDDWRYDRRRVDDDFDR